MTNAQQQHNKQRMDTMKTIGYLDRTEGKIIRAYHICKSGYNMQSRNDRIIDALKELEHVGNIEVYLLKGKKQRLLFTKNH